MNRAFKVPGDAVTAGELCAHLRILAHMWNRRPVWDAALPEQILNERVESDMRRRLPGSSFAERSRSSGSRSGIATVWVIASVPVIATFLVVLMDLANIWLARTELKNGLDAAGLSAMKTWGEGGTTAQARTAANDAVAANTILGNTITLNTTDTGAGNGNPATNREILLGAITEIAANTQFELNCATIPSCGATPFGVQIEKTVSVSSVASIFLGTAIGPFNVTARSYARFPCPAGPPQLVFVEVVTCP